LSISSTRFHTDVLIALYVVQIAQIAQDCLLIQGRPPANTCI